MNIIMRCNKSIKTNQAIEWDTRIGNCHPAKAYDGKSDNNIQSRDNKELEGILGAA